MSQNILQQNDEDACLPRESIDAIKGPLKEFIHIEAASGFILLCCATLALLFANSEFSEKFLDFWKTRLVIAIGSFRMDYSLQHWINDGLMAIFFCGWP